MASSGLDSVPDHIKAPKNLELKQSSIDADCLGVFSIRPLSEGTEFGPYVGKMVPPDAGKSIDRRYSWEVFDLDTMTLTHILDATNPKDGNWMRYVNSARYFEEQNIVSTQIGQEVYYKAMKDIGPGEELLTWYKKKRGRKRKVTTDILEPLIKQDAEETLKPKPKNSRNPKKAEAVTKKSTGSPKQKKSKVEVPVPAINTEKPKRIRKPKIIPDAYEGSFLVPKKSRPANDDQFEPLKPGQLRRRRKKVAPESAVKISTELSAEKEPNEAVSADKIEEKEPESENTSTMNSTKAPSPVKSLNENESFNYEEIINEVAKGKRGRKKSKDKTENEQISNEKHEKSPNKDNTASQPVSATNTLIEINNSVNWVYPEKGQEYIFTLEKHMITQGPNGCVYTCDICTGIYKNKFSLKRHYLRNHINYRYLSKADIINCLINLQQVLEAEGESVIIDIKTEPDEAHCNKPDSASNAVNDAGCKAHALNHDEISSAADNDAIVDNINKDDRMGNDYADNGFESEKTETAKEGSASVPSNKLVENGVENSEIRVSEKGIANRDGKESKDFKAERIAENEEVNNSELCNGDIRSFEVVNGQKMETDDGKPSLAGKAMTDVTASSDKDKKTNDSLKNDNRLKLIWVKTEQQGLYRCYTCRQIFDTLQEIKCHTALGHPEEINTKMQYSCDKCHMRFYFKHNLVRHSASHENKLESKNRKTKVTVKKEVKKEPASPVSTPPIFTDDGIPRNHQCAICHQRFDSLDLLFKHQTKHENDLAKKKCPCQYCGKDFLSITNMKKHVRFHLGYRITCRYCPEVFSNVGALRKHTRISHPEIYKAKQLDKISRNGALRRPDRKSFDTKEESCDSHVSDKVEKAGKGFRRKSGSRDKLSETEEVVSIENKENSEIKQEEYHFDHGISFTADEIDDGGSRFKFSCTVCKKRFSNYVNMCRHRRKAHGNETRPRPEVPKPLPVTRLNPKKPKPLYSESPEEVALFYASVSHNIATNLNEYIDGKVDSLENFQDHIKVENYTPVSAEIEKDVKPVNLTWEMYNFPPNYKPGKTISFTEIRQEFDIHSDFDSHCKSFGNQSDTINLVSEESEGGDARVRIQGSKILNRGNLNETSNCKDLNSMQSTEDLKNRDSEYIDKNKGVVNITEGSRNTDSAGDSKLSASSGNSDSSKMDLTDGKVFSILRRKLQKSKEDCVSPFKHIENGEYANFDDLLIGDIDSPIIPRSQSVSSGISYKKRDLLKTSSVNKSENMLDSLANGNSENSDTDVVMNSEDKMDLGPVFSPQSLSFLCENLLGLKRKETINVSQNLSSGSSSLSSLDSHSSGIQSGYNGSWLTTLSLAASQKENERFQSTNQIFRDIKGDYSEAPDHTLDNYHDIAFGKNGQVACVCAICKKHFRDFECLIRHHWKKHPASICQFIEVEQGNEIDTLHFSEPSTVGALAVTDPGLDNVSEREVFTCTGCGTVFKTLAKLHIHIVSCTPIYPAKGDKKGEKGSKTPIKKKIQNKVRNILNGGNNFKFKIQEFAGYDKEKDEKVKEVVKTQNRVEAKTQNRVFSGFTGFRTILPKPPMMPESPVKPDPPLVKPDPPLVKLPRRKSQELMGYNPQNHVRRRELTELVDCHQCEACGLKFKTIILLERHVPNCSRKEKFKELCPMKCPIMDQSLEKLKHVCHYCQKHFTYLKSLVNHLQDFCLVKKQKIDTYAITEEDRVKENDIIAKFKKLEEEKSGPIKVVENGAKKKGWQKGVKRKPKKKGHSWTLIKKKKPSNSEMNGDSNADIIDAVDNGLVDKSSSSDEHEEIEADHDLNKGTLYVNMETSAVKDNSEIMQNEMSAGEFYDKAPMITIAPLDDPELLETDTNDLDMPHSLETADSIDEVDSGNDVHFHDKDDICHILTEDNNGKVHILHTESSPVLTEENESIQQSESKINMKTDEHMPNESFEQEDQQNIDDEMKSLGNVEENKDNEAGSLIKGGMAQSEKLSCDDQTVKVLTTENSDQNNEPFELETVARRERTKSFIFQCIGSQVKIIENENNSTEPDKPDTEEKNFNSGWKKFRKSMKKKLGRSKGQYGVNRDIKEDKIKENSLLKSFRRTRPKSLEKLFQGNVEFISHDESEPGNEKPSTGKIITLPVEEENSLIGTENVLSDDQPCDIQASISKGKEEKNLYTETGRKGIVVEAGTQNTLQKFKKEDDNVSVDLTDEIQIFEIAASGSICFNVHNVRTKKPSLPVNQQLASDKEASEPVLKNGNASLSSSAASQCLTSDFKSNQIELGMKTDSSTKENNTEKVGVKEHMGNTYCDSETGKSDYQPQIRKDNNRTPDDSCCNPDLVSNESDKNDISDDENDIIDSKNMEAVSNNFDTVNTSSDFTNGRIVSPNDLSSNHKDSDEAVSDEEEQLLDNPVKDFVEPNTLKECEDRRSMEIIPSVVKGDTDMDRETDSFICESYIQSGHTEGVTELVSDRETSMILNENKIESNANVVEKIEIQKVVSEISTDTIPASLDYEPIFESVSEKVKKRKRNASSRQFSEFITENENIEKVKRISVVKKTGSKNKRTGIESSSTSDTTKKSDMSVLSNANKATESDKIRSKVTSKKSYTSNKPIKHSVVSKERKSEKETSKVQKLSKVKNRKSTSPKFKSTKATSPVKSDKPFEVVLSPSERVKMNQRQCRKEFYNFGFSYMNKIERMPRKGITKNAEFIKSESEAGDDSVKDKSQESRHLSSVSDTVTATSSLNKNQTIENTELQAAHVTAISSDKAEDNIAEKRIQNSKSKSKLPRKISKESLAIGAKLAGSSMNLSDSLKETDMRRKRGRPKAKESSEKSQSNPPSKVPKFASKNSGNLSLSEAVNAKRQSKAKMSKGTQSFQSLKSGALVKTVAK